jgi:urea transport system permease protein
VQYGGGATSAAAVTKGRQILMRALAILILVIAGNALAAVDPALVKRLAGDNDAKVAAIAEIVATGDPEALKVLKSLADGELKVDGEEIVLNNRVRRELESAMAALALVSPDREARLAAVKALGGADESILPLVKKALAKESDPDIKPMLQHIAATMELKSADKEVRIAAIRTLGASSDPNMKLLLLPLIERASDGKYLEADDDVRREAQKSLNAVENRAAWAGRVGLFFSGVSLGSILLLAALGLAITYGLMGVINMAHGELIMIGAYTTYVVQNVFRAHLPGAFDFYLLLAVPAAFMVSALVGMALERSVVRWLYGRPLETLLATWGISLILIQLVRTLFGAQNVQVENPAFMSGGFEVLTGVVLPWSRVVIIAFAGVVLAGIWLLLVRTRLGLFVRGVTQNRAMAACVGVHTARVDTWAFGLGSGLAGLAGCALSQIGNVGPDLGQSYIVDSFMVVVLGGVGQLAGTVYAALGLGFANKLLESWSGAVLAKIAVLVFIIIFIQKRPQGLFALKGRAVEA